MSVFRWLRTSEQALKQDLFQAELCAERLKALSDPSRLRIVAALRSGELTVSDLAELLEVELVNVSHHLKIMKQAQILKSRREGRFMYYRLHPDLGQSENRVGIRFDLGCCRLEVPPPDLQ